MNYYTALLLLFGTIAVSSAALYLFFKQREANRIEKLLQTPFSETYKKQLHHTPHYDKLSQEDKEKIQHSIILFINTKEFIGIDFEVTDEMKVIIAFYACLLLLHIETENCYDNLKTILIYPSAVMIDNLHTSNGIFTKEKFLIDGQSSNDTVVIIWHDAKKEAYHLSHDNVIAHEFAHEIDFMDGEIDGVPPMTKSKYNEWTKVLFSDFNKLNSVASKNRDWGKYKLLGSYAATNEAEFFAVTTERFFESPQSLKKHFPELYEELKGFYKIDMASIL